MRPISYLETELPMKKQRIQLGDKRGSKFKEDTTLGEEEGDPVAWRRQSKSHHMGQRGSRAERALGLHPGVHQK